MPKEAQVVIRVWMSRADDHLETAEDCRIGSKVRKASPGQKQVIKPVSSSKVCKASRGHTQVIKQEEGQ